MKYLFNLVFLFVVFVSNVLADQTATLTWSPNKEADLNGYNIYRSCTPIRNYKIIATVRKDVTVYKDTTIPDTCGNIYYKVSAFDTSKNESQFSEYATKSIVIVPPPPVLAVVKDLAAKPVDFSTVELSFSDISTNALGILNYDIRILAGTSMSWPSAKPAVSGSCKSPFVGLITIAKRTCTISGLLPETTYVVQLIPFFGVMNQGADYKDFSNVALVTTLAKPKVFTSIELKDNVLSFDYDISTCSSVTKSTIYKSATQKTIIMTCVK
jgi:hypothetical protein